ncbi:hypothetical protein HK096_010455 [Nowakowskiella sp. JEL0078]|nr:hypothetical protein HK096_010455 [Nowakowskiella sp. JEL0078]
MSVLNPVSKRFEFLGVPGAISFVILVPTIIISVHLLCNNDIGCLPFNYAPNFSLSTLSSLLSLNAFLAIIAWYVLHIVLHIVLPGEWVDGTELRNGKKLKYKINAFLCFLSTIAIGTGFSLAHTKIFPSLFTTSANIPSKLLPLVWIADNAPQLGVAAIIFSNVQALILYLYSFRKNALLAIGGNTQIAVYDFFIGRELNPRPFGDILDLKYFCELRPGLVGWALLDVSYLAKQWTILNENGAVDGSWQTMWELGVSNSAFLVAVMQIIYIADAQYFEKSILSTMDITTDGFGYFSL